MSTSSRLTRLLPSLTPQQRAVLVLRARNANTEPAPELLRDSQAADRRAFNRYMALVYVANADLGALCYVIALQVEGSEFGRNQVSLLNAAAALAEQAEGLTRPAPASRHWRRKKTVGTGEFLRGVAAELRYEALQEVSLRWRELRALEIVWAEVAAEFDGEDPVHPELRQKAAETEVKLRELARELHLRHLPEPEEALVAMTRELLDHAFAYLNLVEPGT
jgi:hypothetical protein